MFGASALITALIEGGKSTLLRFLARCWALGEPFLERAVVPGRVLVVISSKEWDAWAETVGLWDLKDRIFLLSSTHAHLGSAEKAAAFIRYEMRRVRCSYLILDTLFDYLGIPQNNNGDANRLAMNEQEPLLNMIRENGFSLVASGHQPKSEATAMNPRDPQESFAGHTGWSAQHRMRISLRRKSQGVITIVTGIGSPGDQGFQPEQLLTYNPENRTVALAGDFSTHLGRLALPSVLDGLKALGGIASRAKIEEQTGKGRGWVAAGLRHGLMNKTIFKTGKGRSTKYWDHRPPELEEDQQREMQL